MNARQKAKYYKRKYEELGGMKIPTFRIYEEPRTVMRLRSKRVCHKQIVDTEPRIQPKPKMGHWEWVQYDYNPKLGDWHCSECRSVVVECVSKEEKGGIPLYKYCPQCGAKMESECKE